MEVKYNRVEDIPTCDCCDQPHIDLFNLGQYSIEILETVMYELVKCKKQVEEIIATRSPFQYPGIMIDEVGLENFMESPKITLKDLEEKLASVRDELKKRIKK